MRTRRICTVVWAAVALLFALLVTPSTQAQAVVKVGPRLSVELGDIADAPGKDWALGVDARIRSEDFPVQANGSLEYDPASDNLTIFTFDANAVFMFDTEDQSITPYAGLGLGVIRVSSDVPSAGPGFDANNTELGTNFVGGAEFEAGFVTPFAQAQFTNGNDIDRFAVTGGLLLTF